MTETSMVTYGLIDGLIDGLFGVVATKLMAILMTLLFTLFGAGCAMTMSTGSFAVGYESIPTNVWSAELTLRGLNASAEVDAEKAIQYVGSVAETVINTVAAVVTP